MPYVLVGFASVPASPASPAAAVRGACPSVHRPFAEVDGSLLRVRVPGGVLDAGQVAAVAAAAGGATVEVTNRANLQLRGVADPERVTGALVAAGVATGDAEGDGRRNVLASPLAGIDPTELIDVGPMVVDVAGYLGRNAPAGLSPKFCVVLDGGGRLPVWARRHDVALVARAPAPGVVGFEVSVGSVLADRGSGQRRERVPVVGPDRAVAVVAAAAELEVASPLAERVAEGREGSVLAEIAARAGVAFEWVSAVSRSGPGVLPPLGCIDQDRPDRVAIGALPLLGRLQASALAALSDLAVTAGSGEIRLTPWRSVLVPGVTRTAAGPVIDRLGALDLVTNAADPAAGVVACAGATGCPAGLADVQADAQRLIDRLRAPESAGGAARPATVRTVHLSGCAKRCASRDPHDVTLVAGPEPGTYERQVLGMAPLTGLTPDQAVAAAIAAGESGR